MGRSFVATKYEDQTFFLREEAGPSRPPKSSQQAVISCCKVSRRERNHSFGAYFCRCMYVCMYVLYSHTSIHGAAFYPPHYTHYHQSVRPTHTRADKCQLIPIKPVSAVTFPRQRKSSHGDSGERLYMVRKGMVDLKNCHLASLAVGARLDRKEQSALGPCVGA
jgi:hypothetical protein